MDATPRLKSAFPATPPRNPRSRRPLPLGRGSPTLQREPLPQIPTIKTSPSPPTDSLIPISYIDAPSQRLYAFTIWVLLCAWKIYDYTALQESEEQSLWLFMKWVAIDGVFLFGLPSMRIPWLEWSSATMTLIFFVHAFIDGMLMFRVTVPFWAVLGVMWRGIFGTYETAVNEYNVNPNNIMFNESLILGRQVIHILPEGSAVLNPERQPFCIGQGKSEVRLPITINATNPIGMDILRVDLETQANETLHISKSQIKAMHKDASRLISYSEDPKEPKTLYYAVKKPGLYVLAKVVDESNLEVSRKKLAHTVVVPCPKAAFVPADADRCRGELSNVGMEVSGTPPMRVKYRQVVDQRQHESTFENIQPDDLVSPLVKQDQSALVVPNRVDVEWARSRSVHVPLSEVLDKPGHWLYAIDEITDGFGNIVTYTNRDQKDQERHPAKSSHLHQAINVHERPNVQFLGCTPQRPLKVAKGRHENLPLRFASTGKAEIAGTPHHLKYRFSPQDTDVPVELSMTLEDSKRLPSIKNPGLYTLTGVRTDFCEGDILEPSSCLLENPPEPKLSISDKPISDKCAGNPVGLSVDLDLTGTPPFEVRYTVNRKGDGHHTTHTEPISGHRGQIELTPQVAGHFIYEFTFVSDAVYKGQPLKGLRLEQSVSPSASARILSAPKRASCIDQQATVEVAMVGKPPFDLDYEVVHGGKRLKNSVSTNSTTINLETDHLREGGDYTVALISITDNTGCKEFLKDETSITVRHQKPKAAFGPIEGRRIVDALEDSKVSLPVRLSGSEGPWTVKYLDSRQKTQTVRLSSPNDRITVDRAGMYELLEVSDITCPGVIDEPAKNFQVNWISRPEVKVAGGQNIEQLKDGTLIKHHVCEGTEDAVEVLFKGSPPYTLSYVQHTTPDHGAAAPRNKELRAALNVASLRMDSSQAGKYEYRFSKLKDGNYDANSKHFSPVTIQQQVYARPSAAFTNPGKTYGFCSVESDGDEIIPITLSGLPPFSLEVEVKHHGSFQPELIIFPEITTHHSSIRIPHSKLHLGKSAVSLRRVSDDRGCARTLDSTTPRVQISVHDAPTITSLEERTDYCTGDRINFALSGVAPFEIFYTFEGAQRKARIASGNTFRRLAEKPGTFTITGIQDSASSCRAAVNITKRIHGMPSARISKGKETYIDIHEGGQAEIFFEFGGTPPFEFTYTRSENTERGGKKHGAILDMRSEVSDENSMRIWASEEGTYEVVAIKDAHCAYAKPGVKGVEGEKRKKLQY